MIFYTGSHHVLDKWQICFRYNLYCWFFILKNKMKFAILGNKLKGIFQEQTIFHLSQSIVRKLTFLVYFWKILDTYCFLPKLGRISVFIWYIYTFNLSFGCMIVYNHGIWKEKKLLTKYFIWRMKKGQKQDYNEKYQIIIHRPE